MIIVKQKVYIMKGRVVNTETTIANYETGEITQVTTSKTYRTKIADDDMFYQIYYNVLLSKYPDLHGSVRDFLELMCARAEYNTGKIVLSAVERQEISDILNISRSTFSQRMKALLDMGIITGGGGTYYISPDAFWKGDKETRRKLLSEGTVVVTMSIEKD